VFYDLLGGNTAAPSGLYAGLCHAFLVVIYIADVLYIFILSEEKGRHCMKVIHIFDATTSCRFILAGTSTEHANAAW